ncbi:MAG: galactose-1-phosphate uridylyltransferase [Deltaproteobacteria bacterium]|nr:galactose-1-phosphate uridylyltransferase [Deltaproteobacteria bacterium]
MPELRQNMATKEWVILATERARRPEEFVLPGSEREALPPYDPECPFCPGNEEAELETMRMPLNTQQPWSLRVVRNKFPALVPGNERTRVFDGVHRSMSGVGHHEVIVETPRHDTCPALQSVDEVQRTLRAFQVRGRTFLEDPRVEHVIYFKNHGVRAGTSLIHPHAQLIALPVVPHQYRVRGDEARRYFDDFGQCVMCRMLHDELDAALRVVVASEHFVAFVPYAAFSPFHMWIAPRRHGADFLASTRAELDDLGSVLHQVLRKLYFGLNDPDYNYIIRTAPAREVGFEYLHWYLALVPRVNQSAGFELGSGMFINTALPEDSAAFLRATPADGAGSADGPDVV